MSHPSSSDPERPADSSLNRLGRFQLERVVLERPEGRVYEAADPLQQQPVLVKHIRPELAGNEKVRAALLRGVIKAESMAGPRVVPAEEAHERAEGLYLVSPRPAGAPASSIRLQPDDIKGRGDRIVATALDALAAVHEIEAHGVLSVDSLWVSPEGDVTVADTGLAALRPVLQRRSNDLTATVHEAPELARAGARAGPASDQFALGMILYGLFSGQVPGGALPSLRTLSRGVSRRASDVIDRMLASSPADRFDTAAAARTALVRRSAVPRSAVVAVVLLLALGVTAFVFRDRIPVLRDLGARAAREEQAAAPPPKAFVENVSSLFARVDPDASPEQLDRLREALGKWPDRIPKERAYGIVSAAARDDIRRRLARLPQRSILVRNAAVQDQLQRGAEAELSDSIPRDLGDAQRRLLRVERSAAAAATRLDRWDSAVFSRDAFAEIALASASPSSGAAGASASEAEAIVDARDVAETFLAGAADLLMSEQDELIQDGGGASTNDPSILEATGDELLLELAKADGGAAMRSALNVPDEGEERERALAKLKARPQVRLELHSDHTWTAHFTGSENPEATASGTWRRGLLAYTLDVLLVGKQKLQQPVRLIVVVRGNRVIGIWRLFALRTPNLVLGSGLGGAYAAPQVPAGVLAVSVDSPTPLQVRGQETDVAGRVQARQQSEEMVVNDGMVRFSSGGYRTRIRAKEEGLHWIQAEWSDYTVGGAAVWRRYRSDHTAPRIELLKPTPGERLEPGTTVRVSGYAYDPHLHEVSVNGRPAALQRDKLGALYSVDVVVPAEQQIRIVVTAEDTAGNVGRLGVSRDRAEMEIPDIVFAQPQPDEVIGSRVVTVSGYVPRTVPDSTLTVNGRVVPVVQGQFQTTAQGDKDGRLKITAEYTGRWIKDTTSDVTAIIDTTPPILEVERPDGEYTTNIPWIVVRGRVRDANPDIVRVNDRVAHVRRNGTFRKRVDLEPRTWTTIRFQAEDEGGNLSREVERRVYFDPPIEDPGRPYIEHPRERQVLVSTQVVVRGRVHSFIPGSWILVNGIRHELSGRSFAVQVIADGEGVFDIEVEHRGDNLRPRSAIRTVIIDHSAPIVRIDTPAAQETETERNSIIIRGRVLDASVRRARLYVDGRAAPLRIRRGGRFDARITPLRPGAAHRIEVVAIDAAGNRGRDWRIVRRKKSEPRSIVLIRPALPAVYTRLVRYEGQAQPRWDLWMRPRPEPTTNPRPTPKLDDNRGLEPPVLQTLESTVLQEKVVVTGHVVCVPGPCTIEVNGVVQDQSNAYYFVFQWEPSKRPSTPTLAVRVVVKRGGNIVRELTYEVSTTPP